MATYVIMPKNGIQMEEGTITTWFKKVGDEVVEGEPLFEMETDKVCITVESKVSGTLLKILCEEGETAAVAENIAIIGEKGEVV